MTDERVSVGQARDEYQKGEQFAWGEYERAEAAAWKAYKEVVTLAF